MSDFAKDTNVPTNDCISRQAAIDTVYDAFSYAYCDNCENEMNEDLCEDCHRKYQNWSASKKTIEKVINDLPSAQSEQKSRLAREIEGLTPEETYVFLDWLLHGYGLQYTDSRQAVIEWLRGE